MDVFGVHDRLMADYRAFTSGGVDVRDGKIAEYVRQGLDGGERRPDPWLSPNPDFAPGGSVSDLVKAGVLHPVLRRAPLWGQGDRRRTIVSIADVHRPTIEGWLGAGAVA